MLVALLVGWLVVSAVAVAILYAAFIVGARADERMARIVRNMERER